MTIDDETGVANVVIWMKAFEKYRRIVLGAGMIGIKGRIQREGEVVHVVARDLIDLSAELASVGSRDTAFPLPQRRIPSRIASARSARYAQRAETA